MSKRKPKTRRKAQASDLWDNYKLEEIVVGYEKIGDYVRLLPGTGEAADAFRRRHLRFHLEGVEQWRACVEKRGDAMSVREATAYVHLVNRVQRDLWGLEQYSDHQQFVPRDVVPRLDAIHDKILAELAVGQSLAVIYHNGNNSYALAGGSPVVVTQEEHQVLTAFRDAKAALSTKNLEKTAANISRIMYRLAEKFPRSVRFPARKGEGYFVDVRTAVFTT